MTNGLRDTLARGFVSMLKAMQPAMDRFNKFMASPAGQRMARGLETAMSLLGQAVGVVLDKITALGTWIGNNFTTVMEVAGVLALVYAKNMLTAAAATAIANLPLLLTIGLVAAVVAGLQNAGFTARDIFTGIGQAAGTLYAFVYNLVGLGYNMFASVANFIGNVFKDPISSVKILFLDMAITVLGHIQTMAQGIEDLINKIPGVSVNLTSGIDKLYAAAANKRDKIKTDSGWTQYVDPMAYKDYGATANAWGDKFGSFADKFTNFSLDNATASTLKNIDKNTSSISKKLSDEDLKYLEDVAIRKYERNSNTTLAPQIKVVMQGNADKSVGYDIGNLSNTAPAEPVTPTLVEVQAAKLTEVNAACDAAITAGCDVTLSDGTAGHISLTIPDQINLSTAQEAIKAGGTGYAYHLDGALCEVYPAADIAIMAKAATAHVLYHQTYCNHVRAWVKRCTTITAVEAITYGAVLPDDLKAHMATVLGGDNA